jgi:sigma-E factor negative regulatory protein RseC
MLEERGVVVAVPDPQKAQVKVSRSGACEQCASSKICQAMGAGKEMLVTAGNPLQAQIGQQVLLALPGKTFLRASVIVYLIPVLALFGGAVTGQQISQAWAVVGASLGLGLSFLGLWYYNKHLKADAYLPTITRILE